jgi:glycosyltransferase involved in cell wall biosynthesis
VCRFLFVQAHVKKVSLLYFASSRPDYSQAGKIPSVIFYGTDRLRNDETISFDVRWQRNKLLQLLCRPLEQYLIRRVGVGFRLDQALTHFFSFRNRDVILAETDSGGLPLLLLKRIGLLKTHIGFISAGLINELERQQETKLFRWYRWLLRGADFIVCWSPLEAKLFRDLTGSSAQFVLLEADTDFYQLEPRVLLEKHILCVGRDIGRDFQTLFSALQTTGIPAKVVTSAHRVKGLHIPKNVELILEHVDYQTLLDWYRRARLVVVSLQEIHRSTGQRALLEALAMGKATIVAKTLAVTSAYALRDGEDVVFYTPGNVRDLSEKIQRLYDDEAIKHDLGVHGREFVEQLPKNAFYHGVRDILLKICAES